MEFVCLYIIYIHIYICKISSRYFFLSDILWLVLEGLFSFCVVVPIFITFWGASDFQDTYHGFVYFLTFSIFLSGFFILLVREKHRKTLYRFLLAKIKGWDKNNRDKNSEHNE